MKKNEYDLSMIHDESGITFAIRRKNTGIGFPFTLEDGKYKLAFAMCTYGHEDYKTFESFAQMLQYVSDNSFSASFSGHICSECYAENCI